MKDVLEFKLNSLSEYSNLSVSEISEEIVNINNKLNLHHNKFNLLNSIEKLNLELKQLESDELSFLDKEVIYIKYMNLMKSDGVILTEILKRLTEKFSNEMFQFKTLSERKNGALYSDLSVKYKVDGDYLNYEELSSGQRTLCDVYFLFRTILSSGVLILDEFLKYLDINNINTAIEFLESMNIKNLVVSTHSDNFVMDCDKIEFIKVEGEGSKINLS
jgi:DNA repair exonuclease SbcCD ATPase subunit